MQELCADDCVEAVCRIMAYFLSIANLCNLSEYVTKNAGERQGDERCAGFAAFESIVVNFSDIKADII